ncbi:MAG: aldolase [Candidatus Nitrohelix vancouverensis]|uniref:Aldolase n=1 Tax=Candidatus Nitrohelix vancouverensis TaxID=2705534 RepID=A0A7T0C414_9BACT|nr:MAG: aldolase [Candidatus Nitrohelix vancouverensis]
MKLYGSKNDIENALKGAASIDATGIKLINEDAVRGVIDDLVYNAAVNPDQELRGFSRFIIRSAALQMGIIPSSIQGLYEARGRGECKGFTVPALNIRGMSYELSRAIFRTSSAMDAGAFIFEIAKSEIGYTKQMPPELAATILGAAIKEGFKGPVFIQGDHFQVNAQKYGENPKKEIDGLKTLIDSALMAGFYNIDIDTSTLVDLSHESIVEQQRANFEVGVELTSYIRQHEPEGIEVSVGGEIGEVGKENSTEAELRAYLDNFNSGLEKVCPGKKGISKISIQTGTSHGGVPLPDGSVAEVNLDFETLENLSRISRDTYGLAGAVQHGASTLPPDCFNRFPELETAEIHLATSFQNRIFESKHFPKDFKETIYSHLREKFASENKGGMTDEQFIYKTRKKSFGEFKKEFWDLPEEIKSAIGKELENEVAFLFEKLSVGNTREIVEKSVQPLAISPSLEAEIANA